jgi:Amt family ammonium transporter
MLGLIAGAVCFCAVVVVKQRLGYDDSLDAFGIHGIGGVTGALLTGVFASLAVNPAGADGLLHGNTTLLSVQALAVLAVAAYAATITFVLAKIVDACVGLRVTEEEETEGLDHTQHKESAYTLLD